MNAMKKERIIVIIVFIIVAILIFYIGKVIEDYAFIQFAPEDLFNQFKYGFNLRLFFYGVEIILLILFSISGLQISKRKGAVEYSKGFYVTTILSTLLLLAYLVVFFIILFW